ncbi:hypothetical protein ACFQ6O_42465 [Streptomyces sp. NPDC056441]|uniref:hypothetical protein n=1 Tax=Streptomyces sp. NPDC056441 TaxID=3345817 RepID=UPI003676C2FE
MSDRHRQNERLLSWVCFPAFVVSEVAVELELGHSNNGFVELGDNDVQPLGLVAPAVSQTVRGQQLRHH